MSAPPAHRLLRDALVAPRRMAGGLPVQPDQVAALLRLAIYQGVAGHLVDAVVRHAGADHPVARAGHPIRHQLAAHHLRALAGLSVCGSALDAADVAWLVMKGPTLAQLHGGAHRRQYSDLDVLVHPDQLQPAVAALTDAGIDIPGWAWAHSRRRGWTQVHARLPQGVPLDLHWHAINDPARRTAHRVEVRAPLARRRRALVDGTPACVADPTDATLLTAVHAALSGAHRLVWLIDLMLLAGQPDIDPRALRSRAATWDVTAELAVMAQRVQALWGTPCPSVVDHAPTAWAAAWSVLAASTPPRPGRPWWAWALRATRPTTAASLRALATDAAGVVGAAVGGETAIVRHPQTAPSATARPTAGQHPRAGAFSQH